MKEYFAGEKLWGDDFSNEEIKNGLRMKKKDILDLLKIQIILMLIMN